MRPFLLSAVVHMMVVIDLHRVIRGTVTKAKYRERTIIFVLRTSMMV